MVEGINYIENLREYINVVAVYSLPQKQRVELIENALC